MNSKHCHCKCPCEGECGGKHRCEKCAPEWTCGKCYQLTLENPGELIPNHFRTCPKREQELKENIIDNLTVYCRTEYGTLAEWIKDIIRNT